MTAQLATQLGNGPTIKKEKEDTVELHQSAFQGTELNLALWFK